MFGGVTILKEESAGLGRTRGQRIEWERVREAGGSWKAYHIMGRPGQGMTWVMFRIDLSLIIGRLGGVSSERRPLTNKG
jgi:hypothetical protein